MDTLLQLLRKFLESSKGGAEMKEKSILVSVRVNPELYKEVKKKAIDRDDSITAIVKRAFEMYIEEEKRMEQKELIQKVNEERKSWDNEELESAIVAVLDRENLWDAARKLIPDEWFTENDNLNREEVEKMVETYGDENSFDGWAVILWLFEQFGEEYDA